MKIPFYLRFSFITFYFFVTVYTLLRLATYLKSYIWHWFLRETRISFKWLWLSWCIFQYMYFDRYHCCSLLLLLDYLSRCFWQVCMLRRETDIALHSSMSRWIDTCWRQPLQPSWRSLLLTTSSTCTLSLYPSTRRRRQILHFVVLNSRKRRIKLCRRRKRLRGPRTRRSGLVKCCTCGQQMRVATGLETDCSTTHRRTASPGVPGTCRSYRILETHYSNTIWQDISISECL